MLALSPDGGVAGRESYRNDETLMDGYNAEEDDIKWAPCRERRLAHWQEIPVLIKIRQRPIPERATVSVRVNAGVRSGISIVVHVRIRVQIAPLI